MLNDEVTSEPAKDVKLARINFKLTLRVFVTDDNVSRRRRRLSGYLTIII